jgi:thymidylate kinase
MFKFRATMFKRKKKRYEFTPDERQRMEEYLKRKTAQKEVVGLLDRYSGDFADWTNTISEAVNEAIARKLQKNDDCEKERKILNDVSALFSKLANNSAMLADWNAQLTVGIKHTETMMEEGHP